VQQQQAQQQQQRDAAAALTATRSVSIRLTMLCMLSEVCRGGSIIGALGARVRWFSMSPL
jgi:hypothetical protein